MKLQDLRKLIRKELQGCENFLMVQERRREQGFPLFNDPMLESISTNYNTQVKFIRLDLPKGKLSYIDGSLPEYLKLEDSYIEPIDVSGSLYSDNPLADEAYHNYLIKELLGMDEFETERVMHKDGTSIKEVSLEGCYYKLSVFYNDTKDQYFFKDGWLGTLAASHILDESIYDLEEGQIDSMLSDKLGNMDYLWDYGYDKDVIVVEFNESNLPLMNFKLLNNELVLV